MIWFTSETYLTESDRTKLYQTEMIQYTLHSVVAHTQYTVLENCTESVIACKLIACNYQIPMWKVWTAIQFSCSKQSLIRAIWWKTTLSAKPKYDFVNVKLIIEHIPQSSWLSTFAFKRIWFLGTQLTSRFQSGVIMTSRHSLSSSAQSWLSKWCHLFFQKYVLGTLELKAFTQFTQLAFQMVSSWGSHFGPGSFPGRQVWRGWLGNDRQVTNRCWGR